MLEKIIKRKNELEVKVMDQNSKDLSSKAPSTWEPKSPGPRREEGCHLKYVKLSVSIILAPRPPPSKNKNQCLCLNLNHSCHNNSHSV